MLVKKTLLMVMCALVISGCAARRDTQSDGQLPGTAEFLDTKLSLAAKDIALRLDQLVQMEASRARPSMPQIAPPTAGPLSMKATVTYNGAISEILQDIVRKIGSGWVFRETGRPPLQPVIVRVESDGTKTWFEILENIGWQASDRADVVVSENEKSALLAWQGMPVPKAQKANHRGYLKDNTAAKAVKVRKASPKPAGTNGGKKTTILKALYQILPAGWRYQTQPESRNIPVNLVDTHDWRESLLTMCKEAGVTADIDDVQKRVTLKVK